MSTISPQVCRLLLTAVAFLPAIYAQPAPDGPLAAAFAEGRGTGLTDMLRAESWIDPRVTGPLANLEVRLRNVATKEITALTGAYRAVYADGTERVAHGWGEDLVGFAASLRTVVGSAPPGSTLKPGEEITLRLTTPLDTRGNPPVRVSVGITMLLFADRTACGDRRDIDRMLRSRVRSAAELAEALDSGRRLLAAPQPESALDARVSELAAQGRRSVEYSYLAILAALWKTGEPSRLDQFQRMWEARRQEISAHSTLTEPAGSNR
jgi:hypothetical protein